MTPLQRAQRVEELDREATKGPWRRSEYVPHAVFLEARDADRRSRHVTASGPSSIGTEHDAAFIAETRTLAPALAADVRDLSQRLDQEYALSFALKEQVQALTDLLRDAFPMFSHVPLLRDRAGALGLVPEVKEPDPAPTLQEQIEEARENLRDLKARRRAARGQDSYDGLDEAVSNAESHLSDLLDDAQIEMPRHELGTLGLAERKEQSDVT